MNFKSYGHRMVVFLIAASVILVAAAGAAFAEASDDVRGADRDRVGAAAVKAAGGGTAVEVERSDDAGEAYEVEVRQQDGTEVDVALDGQLRVLERDDDDGHDDDDEGRDAAASPDNDDNPNVNRSAKVDSDDRPLTEAERAKVRSAIVKALGSSTVTEAEVSDDRGAAFEVEVIDRAGVEWDIELDAGYDVVSKTKDD